MIDQSSPYLQQHAHNPVDWYPWGDEAFALARRLDRPIFLSIGYSTCHWCHVMEQESFADPEIGAAMNALFVSIKVDREERPDIDQLYMEAAQMMTGSGGWPLNLILTPDGRPFYAATYIPKEDRFGRMGLRSLIRRIDELWHHDRARLLASADSITQALREMPAATGRTALSEALLTRARAALAESFDHEAGGFGDAPKFPSPHKLRLLLRLGERAMVEQTLDAMRAGGIYDQIGFGFHRYATDRFWRVPHFEKMLYDQAMQMLAYSDAFAATGHGRHARVVRELADFVARRLTDPDGAFYSALDADSAGGEGRYYQWSIDELEAALGKEDAVFAARVWGMERRGNYLDEARRLRNGRNIPFLAQPPLDADRARMERIRRRLLAARAQRPVPFRDDKVLTDWNGMMIAALAHAAARLGDDGLLAQARRAAATVLERMWDGKRLRHRWRAGQAAIDGTLDDYAMLVWGLIELYQADFTPRWLQAAVAIDRAMRARFAMKDGGFYLTDGGDQRLLARPHEWFDGATPAGNSVALANLLRLAHLTGDMRLVAQAEAGLRQAAGQMAQAPTGSSALLWALADYLGPMRELVVAGRDDDPELERMVALARRGFHPGLVLLRHDPALFGTVPFLKEQGAIDGRATAYLCENFACNRPVHTARQLAELLDPSAGR
ncbi:MAG: thioredoxin domain-containing protein [Zetaproteobacteria bacterium]|nr:MAG: thioredoxin domain-containing protein [Zetaproteobacteria bacterium]